MKRKPQWAAACLLCLLACAALAPPALAESPHEAAVAALSRVEASIQSALGAEPETTTMPVSETTHVTDTTTLAAAETTTNPFFNSAASEEASFLPKTGTAPRVAFLASLAVLCAGCGYCALQARKHRAR